MKRMNQLYILSCSLLLNGAAYAADMGTSVSGQPSTRASSTSSWTAEEQALGQELIHASTLGNQERIKEILALNPSLINFSNENDLTPLMMATAESMDLLITTGANVNAQSNEGFTLLMRAACLGRTKIVEKLLAARANVNAQEEDGVTALMHAALWGRKEVVQILLSARAHSKAKDSDGQTAFEFALMSKRPTNMAVLKILQNYVDTEPEEETLMVKPAV